MKKKLRKILGMLAYIWGVISIPIFVIGLGFEFLGYKLMSDFFEKIGISTSHILNAMWIWVGLLCAGLMIRYFFLVYKHEKSALKTAKAYMTNNAALIQKYGEKYKHSRSLCEIPEDIENGMAATIHFKIYMKRKEVATYILTLEYQSGEWLVLEMKEKK